MPSKKSVHIYFYVFLIFTVGCSVYLNFIGSPIVFDDHNVATVQALGGFLFSPFPLAPRSVPYFSIAVLNVISSGEIIWNRWFNLVLLNLTTLALACFLKRVGHLLSINSIQPFLWQAIVLSLCAWFILNPVAVYGVAYLAQRTILMATLFSLISATLYLRAHSANRSLDLVSAALFASIAMLCKEHAAPLPLAIAALTPLVKDWDRVTIRRCVFFVLLLLPMSYWVVSSRAPETGSAYEIYAGEILNQFSLPPLFNKYGGLWGMSIATQLGLFIRYFLSWIWPNPDSLSADMRIDFELYWTGLTGYLSAAFAILLVLASFFLISRKTTRPELRLISTGIAYVAMLFVVELSVVRIQEAFVLYRSFLWVPGYALIVGGILLLSVQKVANWNIKVANLTVFVLPLLFFAMTPWTIDRLKSLSSEEAVWLDALKKLPRPSTPGADRIYYNLAGEAYKKKNYQTALDYSEQVIKQNPGSFQGYLAKGTSLVALNDYQGATEAFDQAERLPKPEMFIGYIQFKRCIVIELGGGPTEEVMRCLKKSASMGYSQAKMILQLRQNMTEK